MNAIVRHQNWREKRNNSRHSGFWRASYQHQTLASTPAPCARYLSTCTCSPGHIRCHHSANSFNAKWVQTTLTSTQHHPLTMTAVSLASPREAEGIPPLYPSKLRSSDPHRGGTRSRVDARGRPKARSDLPVVIRVFSQNCVRKRTCRWSRGVHSELWMTPPPLSIKELLYWMSDVRDG